MTTLRSLAIGGILLVASAAGAREPVSDASVPSASFDYLYMEANEDQASGGHAAIRIEDDVFHFQYDDGLLRMERDDWRDFQLSYRGLRNRSIHRSRVAISQDTLRLLRAAFVRKHLTQSEQIDRLRDAQADARLVAALSSDGPVEIELPGLAFYAPAIGGSDVAVSPRIRALREGIALRYGPDFLAAEEARVRSSLSNLDVNVLDPRSLDFDPRSLPRPRYAFHQRYADGVAALRSLEALRGGAVLAPKALTTTKLRWEPEERVALVEAADELQRSLVILAKGTRPDWGSALLLGMARLQAIEASLDSGSWSLLDTLGSDSIVVEIGPRNRQVLPRLEEEARTQWLRALAVWKRQTGWDELAFGRLESSASRLAELEGAVSGARNLRMRESEGIPIGMGRLQEPIRPSVLKLDGPRLSEETKRAAQRTEELAHEALGYRLITRNCVSELFASVALAMTDALEEQGRAVDTRSLAAELEARFGAAVRANPIPFVSSIQVRRAWRVVSTDLLPSFRLARADAIYRANSSPWVRLRESNTLTSTLYSPSDADSFFLFFTDDQVLPRPLEGLANLMAGLGRAGVGLLQLPFDGGQSLSAGMRGALFSLPEIAFFNIRKGTNAWIAPELRPEP